ncbi:MAG: hypothetical protein HC774_04575 [Sphingomonadales bacterium]|nr:hypothetical protein [Sphingomonadales bacterium]
MDHEVQLGTGPKRFRGGGTGIILGLRARDLTGKGQPVHITMLNANAWTNADEYYDHANRPPLAMPDEELHGLHALYRLYRCREGWVFLGCLFQDEWETFCRTVQRGDLLADRRFATREARQAHDEALISEIAAIFAGRTAAEWEDLLIKADIGCVRPTKHWRECFMRTIPTPGRMR